MFKTVKKYLKRGFWIGLVGLLVWYATCLPGVLFKDSTSLVLIDSQKEVLGAHVASDGQWRFPTTSQVNPKFSASIVTFEDKRFHNHIGVDFKALARAIKLNVSQGKVVSGGSTLSMQVIRMSRKNPKRTYLEKLTEMFRATRLELRYTKQEILNFYASNAPFGGNVVGIDAASWKYFGKDQSKLSWAEAAMLAVLPNAPSLIHLGKNRDRLLKKRNFLLDKLNKEGKIDQLTCSLAKLEPLPAKPKSIPNKASHLKNYYLAQHNQQIVKTTLAINLQEKVRGILQRQLEKKLKPMAVHNASAIVVEVKTGEIKAYVGNVVSTDNSHENAIDMIRAKRSTGSILKPILYSNMLSDGKILPHSLVKDVPVEYYGYEPQNFDMTYDGVVPANQIITRSLNIPSVNLLHDYGVNRFLIKLQEAGFKSIDKTAGHYGLSLILGGAEVTSLELAKVYTNMSQKLAGYPLRFSDNTSQKEEIILDKLPNKMAIYQMMDAMSKLSRPNGENAWKVFNNNQKIAWKTGTSFGGRDAWAVGCTPDYVVVTWAGNADGEGRPSLTGSSCAAPILFDVFNVLTNKENWFLQPTEDVIEASICSKSGCLANKYCENKVIEPISVNGRYSDNCHFCKPVTLDSTGTWLVEGTTYPPFNRVEQTYFILEPMEAFYYQKKHTDYDPLPPMINLSGDFSIIYPKNNSIIYLPKLDSLTKSNVVFKASVKEKKDKLYWSIDNEFIGETMDDHKLIVSPKPGSHVLSVVNKKGMQLRVPFEIKG